MLGIGAPAIPFAVPVPPPAQLVSPYRHFKALLRVSSLSLVAGTGWVCYALAPQQSSPMCVCKRMMILPTCCLTRVGRSRQPPQKPLQSEVDPQEWLSFLFPLPLSGLMKLTPRVPGFFKIYKLDLITELYYIPNSIIYLNFTSHLKALSNSSHCSSVNLFLDCSSGCLERTASGSSIRWHSTPYMFQIRLSLQIFS